MNASELRNKSVTDLDQALHDLLKEQFNLRMQQGTGQRSRPHLMAQVRKDIARVKTIMNELKAGEAS